MDVALANTRTVPVQKPIFWTAMVCYLLGLVASLLASVISNYPQPALLYLSPLTLGGVSFKAYSMGHFRLVWQGPAKEKQEGDEVKKESQLEIQDEEMGRSGSHVLV